MSSRSPRSVAALILAFAASSSAACARWTPSSPPPDVPTPDVTSAVDTPAERPCVITAPPSVLASHVQGTHGVEARVREDGDVDVLYAEEAGDCRALAVSPTANSRAPRGPFVAGCPLPFRHARASATQDGETMFAWSAWDSSHTPHIFLGVPMYASPRAFFGNAVAARSDIVRHGFYPPEGGPGGGERGPVLSAAGGRRFLLAWVEGQPGFERLRGQPVAGWGDPAGPPLELSPEDARVIGRPSIAIGPDGDGVVAYLASNGTDVTAMATPIFCSP